MSFLMPRPINPIADETYRKVFVMTDKQKDAAISKTYTRCETDRLIDDYIRKLDCFNGLKSMFPLRVKRHIVRDIVCAVLLEKVPHEIPFSPISVHRSFTRYSILKQQQLKIEMIAALVLAFQFQRESIELVSAVFFRKVIGWQVGRKLCGPS